MAILADKTFKAALAEEHICLKRAALYGRNWTGRITACLQGFAAANVATAAGLQDNPQRPWKTKLQDHRTGRKLTLNYNVFTRAFSGDHLVELIVGLAQAARSICRHCAGPQQGDGSGRAGGQGIRQAGGGGPSPADGAGQPVHLQRVGRHSFARAGRSASGHRPEFPAPGGPLRQ